MKKTKINCCICNKEFYKKLEKFTIEFGIHNLGLSMCYFCKTKQENKELKKEIATYNRVSDIIVDPLFLFLFLFFVFGVCLSILKFGTWTVPIIFIIASVPVYISFKNYKKL